MFSELVVAKNKGIQGKRKERREKMGKEGGRSKKRQRDEK